MDGETDPVAERDAKTLATRYKKEIYWSEEDKAFIGSLPEICGPCCDSDTESGVLALLVSIAEGYAYDKLTGSDSGSVPDPRFWPEGVERRS